MPRGNSEAFLARLDAIIEARRAESRLDPTPADPATLFGPDDAAFDRWLKQLAAELAPTNPFEMMYVTQALQAARGLRRAALAEETTKLGDLGWCRYQAQSQRNFDKAMKELRDHRQRLAEQQAAADARRDPEDFSGISPWGEPARYRPGGDWRERIELKPEVSKWPVIKGTDIEAEEINAWLSDGLPAEVLLHGFPMLCIADLLACIDCDRAGKCVKFEHENKPEYFYQDGPPPV